MNCVQDGQEQPSDGLHAINGIFPPFPQKISPKNLQTCLGSQC